MVLTTSSTSSRTSGEQVWCSLVHSCTLSTALECTKTILLQSEQVADDEGETPGQVDQWLLMRSRGEGKSGQWDKEW